MYDAGDIGFHKDLVEEIRDALEKRTLNCVRRFLSDGEILDALDGCRIGYRRRIITPVVTVLHMVAAGLWPEDSLASSWDLVWGQMASHMPEACGKSPSPGSVAKARARIPLAAWDAIFNLVRARVARLSGEVDRWKGHRVVLVDGTTVSMADEEALHEAFGTGRNNRRKYKYPLGRLVTLGIARSMVLLGYKMGRYDDGEGSLTQPLLELLAPGDLVIGDRNFAGANLYATYASKGLEYLTRAHQALAVGRLKPLSVNGRGDFIARLRVHPDHRRQDPSLGETVTARLIKGEIVTRGKREAVWFVTSLLDARKYPAGEVVQLYAWRWRIETLLRSAKVEMGTDVLRSRTAQGVRKEVAARMTALNIVRGIMLEAALAKGIDPLRISFVRTVRMIVLFAPALAWLPVETMPRTYRAMLEEIASHLVPERPGRNEPRALRRELKHYPTMTFTRAQWRASHAA